MLLAWSFNLVSTLILHGVIFFHLSRKPLYLRTFVDQAKMECCLSSYILCIFFNTTNIFFEIVGVKDTSGGLPFTWKFCKLHGWGKLIGITLFHNVMFSVVKVLVIRYMFIFHWTRIAEMSEDLMQWLSHGLRFMYMGFYFSIHFAFVESEGPLKGVPNWVNAVNVSMVVVCSSIGLFSQLTITKHNQAQRTIYQDDTPTVTSSPKIAVTFICSMILYIAAIAVDFVSTRIMGTNTSTSQTPSNLPLFLISFILSVPIPFTWIITQETLTHWLRIRCRHLNPFNSARVECSSPE